jgi:predicted O-linked N-acetylglucosamine transferase (SPINDLY family)
MSVLLSKLAQVQQALAEGRVEQARMLSTRLVQSHGNDPGVNAMQSVVLSRLGQYDQAVFYARRASELLPNEPDLRVRLGQVLAMAGRYAEALPHLERAVRDAPHSAEARSSLMGVLAGQSRFSDAVDVGRAGLPSTDPNLIAFLANALLNASRIEECVALYRDTVQHHPSNTLLLSNLANAMNYMPGVSPEEVFEVHRAFGCALERAVSPLPPANCAPQGSRPLRVGVLSPDLRRHSVAFFVEPWFAHHDPTRVELWVYSTSPVEDEMTRRLKPLVKSWRSEPGTSDRDLAMRMRQDKIDVLVELSGHTVGARLGVLAHRAAPVQVTYLGYPHTTGLTRVDARFVDSITDPSPHADAFATERLVRLDRCFLCFSPPSPSPDVSRGPLQRGEAITFGSFNTAQKINTPLIELWARVLHRVPRSRLLLKATNFADPRLRSDLTSRFEACGIDPARLELLPPTVETTDHLAAYARIDIALDPFPYHGTTTTCEALWMGVPVVTLAGPTHASRVGASLLTQVGLSDLCASTPEQYIEIASTLASDANRLAPWRTNLRDRMRASALCDGPGFAARITACFERLAARAGSMS